MLRLSHSLLILRSFFSRVNYDPTQLLFFRWGISSRTRYNHFTIIRLKPDCTSLDSPFKGSAFTSSTLFVDSSLKLSNGYIGPPETVNLKGWYAHENGPSEHARTSMTEPCCDIPTLSTTVIIDTSKIILGWKKSFENMNTQMTCVFIVISLLLRGQFWCRLRQFVR